VPAQDLRGFSERVALITGAGAGVGRAVALQLALQGAYVVAQHQPTADSGTLGAVAELHNIGTLAHIIEADVIDPEGARVALASVREAYGRLDYLVNACAAENTADLSRDKSWDAVLDPTLRSAWLCSLEAEDLMRGRPTPAIVSVAQRAGGAAAETAANGLTGLTAALARELGPKIRVNCVIAGSSVAPSRSDPRSTAPLRSDVLGPVAPNEVARAVVYLLSADASSINGQSLTVGTT
jgi:3-oxoacyl-[acyl-carrier protein] reductase